MRCAQDEAAQSAQQQALATIKGLEENAVHLTKKIELLKMQYASVVADINDIRQSKGWRLITSLRKARNRLRWPAS
jgi:hypothetical protein